jgi:hypothetical protein
MMNRERFASFLDPVVRFVYENVMEKGPDIVPLVYGVHNTTQAWEKVTGIGAVGLMQPWQGQVYYDDVNPLWDKLYTVQQWSIGLKIERNLWDKLPLSPQTVMPECKEAHIGETLAA